VDCTNAFSAFSSAVEVVTLCCAVEETKVDPKSLNWVAVVVACVPEFFTQST
jgi:hypothetical protein